MSESCRELEPVAFEMRAAQNMQRALFGLGIKFAAELNPHKDNFEVIAKQVGFGKVNRMTSFVLNMINGSPEKLFAARKYVGVQRLAIAAEITGSQLGFGLAAHDNEHWEEYSDPIARADQTIDASFAQALLNIAHTFGRNGRPAEVLAEATGKKVFDTKNMLRWMAKSCHTASRARLSPREHQGLTQMALLAQALDFDLVTTLEPSPITESL